MLVNDSTDWGARINAADATLGVNPGIIEIHGGGSFSTGSVFGGSGKRVLYIGPGIYTNTIPGTSATAPNSTMLRPKSGSSIIGSGMFSTILQESTTSLNFTVIRPYANSQDNSASDTGITISDLQIAKATPNFGSTAGAIVLGNLVGGAVRNVFLNQTMAIGVNIGGSSSGGNSAFGIDISGLYCLNVASQAVGIVNARGVSVKGNLFKDSGQSGGPGAVAIDLESNAVTDLLVDITLVGNVVDNTGSVIASNGIDVSNDNAGPMYGIVLEGNSVSGRVGFASLSNGIFLASCTDVTAKGNLIYGCSQSGIVLSNCVRCRLRHNDITIVGADGNGAHSITLQTGTNHCHVIGNSCFVAGSGTSSKAIYELDTSDYNVFKDNVVGSNIVTVGANTQAEGNVVQVTG